MFCVEIGTDFVCISIVTPSVLASICCCSPTNIHALVTPSDTHLLVRMLLLFTVSDLSRTPSITRVAFSIKKLALPTANQNVIG